MCRSSHFVGVLYLEDLKIDASASREQVVQKILGEFENRFQKRPGEIATPKQILEACRIAGVYNRWSGDGFDNFKRYCGEAVKDLESLDSVWIRSPGKKEGVIKFTGKLAVLLKIVNKKHKCGCGEYDFF